MRTIRLYQSLLKNALRSHIVHQASFWMMLMASFLETSVYVIGIWALVDRFKLIHGWSLPELAILYGIVNIGLSSAEIFFRGFDTFIGYAIKTGEFDRILLRPIGSLLQVATREIQLFKIGRLVQESLILTWGFVTLSLNFFSQQTLLILLSIIGTIALFSALFIIQATVTFWTTETLDLMKITTYGGAEVGQFPMSIYPQKFRLFFTVIIPLACVAYYPLATILQHESLSLWLAYLFPLAGILFFAGACAFWHFGVRHYHSTGS